ncbi:MAG: hypothetical protein M3Q65_01665 [Chloroflexota bacterium]|nr:hypothetical protein [Chloroflexota bacterium]
MSRTQLVTRGGLAMMLGGVLWIALRPLVASSWGQPILGLSYEGYNRLMVAPLLLLLAGVLAFRRSLPPAEGRAARWGLAVLDLGVATSLAGVVIEFWWAGGLRGDRAGALLGWGAYGLGLLGQAVGLTLFGVGALRAGHLPTWLATVAPAMAALHLLWLPSLHLRLARWSVADQVLIGLGWVTLGYALWASRARGRRSPGTATPPAAGTGRRLSA